MSPIRCCETGSYATSTSARSARSAIQTKAPAPHNQMKKSAKLLRNGCSLCSINSRPRRSFKTPPALPHITVPPGCCHIHTYTRSLITVPPGCLSAASPEARSLRRRSCTSWSFREGERRIIVFIWFASSLSIFTTSQCSAATKSSPATCRAPVYGWPMSLRMGSARRSYPGKR